MRIGVDAFSGRHADLGNRSTAACAGLLREMVWFMVSTS